MYQFKGLNMKKVRFYYSRGGTLPLILLPIIAILVIIMLSFFAVIGLVSMVFIGGLALGVSIFRSLKSGNRKDQKNYDRSTNTITLEKKDYDIK